MLWGDSILRNSREQEMLLELEIRRKIVYRLALVYNHRMAWVGRHLKDRLVLASQLVPRPLAGMFRAGS